MTEFILGVDEMNSESQISGSPQKVEAMSRKVYREAFLGATTRSQWASKLRKLEMKSIKIFQLKFREWIENNEGNICFEKFRSGASIMNQKDSMVKLITSILINKSLVSNLKIVKMTRWIRIHTYHRNRSNQVCNIRYLVVYRERRVLQGNSDKLGKFFRTLNDSWQSGALVMQSNLSHLKDLCPHLKIEQAKILHFINFEELLWGAA